MITGGQRAKFGHLTCGDGMENLNVPPQSRGKPPFKTHARTPTPFSWKY
jgi:hypothetical protein